MCAGVLVSVPVVLGFGFVVIVWLEFGGEYLGDFGVVFGSCGCFGCGFVCIECTGGCVVVGPLDCSGCVVLGFVLMVRCLLLGRMFWCNYFVVVFGVVVCLLAVWFRGVYVLRSVGVLFGGVWVGVWWFVG